MPRTEAVLLGHSGREIRTPRECTTPPERNMIARGTLHWNRKLQYSSTWDTSGACKGFIRPGTMGGQLRLACAWHRRWPLIPDTWDQRKLGAVLFCSLSKS
jgi:hypothetical protein